MYIQQSSYNNIDFTINTKSGDKISLNMYDNKEMSQSQFSKNGSSFSEFSLSHSYGYSFSYEGNGIDENDQKEIAEAMKNIRPMIDEYLSNVENSGIPSVKDVLNSAFGIKAELPISQNEDKNSLLKSELLKTFDASLEQQKQLDIILQSANELFKQVIDTFDKFLVYA